MGNMYISPDSPLRKLHPGEAVELLHNKYKELQHKRRNKKIFIIGIIFAICYGLFATIQLQVW